jgi:PKD repeat protein
MKHFTSIAAIFAFFILNVAIITGQDMPVHPSLTGKGECYGLTPPLRSLPVLTPEEFRAMEESGYERNEELQGRSYPYASTALPKGPDPVWQREMGSNRSGREPILNFAGQPCPYYPPDPNGTAGPLYYMQTINLVYAIYDKTDGSLVAGPTDMNELFSGMPGSTCNDGDPLVLYDEQADRWLAVEFSICAANDRMLVAVSQTNDPTGSWYKYSFDVADTPDYEKFGIWPDGYYMATNNPSGNDIYVFERQQMLNGGPAQFVGFDNPWRPSTIDGFMCVPPLDNDGPAAPDGSPGLFITINDDAIGGGSDQLWIYELDADWSNTNSSTFSRVRQIDVPPFDSDFGSTWDNLSQPGTSQKLDAIPMVIMNRPQYRNFGTYETIVCCHTVDLDNTNHAGIRWYELRRTGGNWSIRQTGTYGPDSDSRWMGSIALNGQNEIALGYSIASTSEYPGIRYCGQSAGAYAAGNGELDVTEAVIQPGIHSQTASNRWGDYTDMSVDPENDHPFWYTNQYIGNTGNRLTRIASFEFTSLTLNAMFTSSTTAPCEGNTVSFQDQSTGTPSSWQWTFEGGNPAVSTEQNPAVQYGASGTYDVQLVVSDAESSDTATFPGYIQVVKIPGKAGKPDGPAGVCQGSAGNVYTTISINGASGYQWFVDPSEAGTLTSTGTTATLAISPDFAGPMQLTVRASNDCGPGPVSNPLTVMSYPGPAQFGMPAECVLCNGGPGCDIILEGSEIGVTYELFHQGVTTDITKQGTGSALNFATTTNPGTYTVLAGNGDCAQFMDASTLVTYKPGPEIAGAPGGPTDICNTEISGFTTQGAANATYYLWYLDPAGAGVISGDGLTGTVKWTKDYAGTASVWVQGGDDCGTGPISAKLYVTVTDAPDPVIAGQAEPCEATEGSVYFYSTPAVSGDDFTWTAEGGNVVAIQGSHQTMVSWTITGPGMVIVTETSLSGCSTADTLRVTIHDCTGIPEFQAASLTIFPNPTEDKLTVKCSTGDRGTARILIISSYGQISMQKDIETDDGNIDLELSTSALPAGAYEIQLISPAGRIFQGKVIVKN